MFNGYASDLSPSMRLQRNDLFLLILHVSVMQATMHVATWELEVGNLESPIGKRLSTNRLRWAYIPYHNCGKMVASSHS